MSKQFRIFSFGFCKLCFVGFQFLSILSLYFSFFSLISFLSLRILSFNFSFFSFISFLRFSILSFHLCFFSFISFLSFSVLSVSFLSFGLKLRHTRILSFHFSFITCLSFLIGLLNSSFCCHIVVDSLCHLNGISFQLRIGLCIFGIRFGFRINFNITLILNTDLQSCRFGFSNRIIHRVSRCLSKHREW